MNLLQNNELALATAAKRNFSKLRTEKPERRSPDVAIM
jgi:hypothetical protein